MTQDILYELRDRIAYVTLNRPQARNALTFDMYEALFETAGRISSTSTLSCRTVVRVGLASTTKARVKSVGLELHATARCRRCQLLRSGCSAKMRRGWTDVSVPILAACTKMFCASTRLAWQAFHVRL